MLDRSINLARNHAAYLASKGVRLNPVHGTILNDLFADSLSTYDEVRITDPGSGETATDHPVDVVAPIGCTWGARFDGTLNDLVPIVSAQIAYIANTVKPLTLGFAAQAKEAIDNQRRSVSANSRYEVIQFDIPEILQNDMFLRHVERHASQPANDIGNSVRSMVGRVDLDEVLANVSFGTESLNQLFKDVVHGGGCRTEILTQFNNIVADTVELPITTDYTRVHDLPGNKRAIVLLALFGALTSMLENPSKELKVGSSSYENVINNALDYIGRELKLAISSLTNAVMNGQLVFGVRDGKVYTHEGVFNEWLSKTGLTVEVLLGLAVSGQHLSGVQEISDAAPKLVEVWEEINQLEERNNGKEVVYRMRSIYKSMFADCLREQDENEEEYHRLYPQAMACVVKDADCFIDEATTEQLLDPICMARKLIAGIRFQHTEAEPFMCDMERVASEHGGDSNEASLMALVAYLGRFLGSMIHAEQLASAGQA